jgi:penicillin-binding protein 1A
MIPDPTPAPGRMTSRMLVATGFMAAAIIGVAGGLLFVSMQDMPDTADLTRFSASPATKLYDSSNPPDLIAQLSIEQRTFVPLSRMPRALQDATVAIEDERFYSHWGLDLWGIARAAVVNTISRRVVEGGSTLTQQLARNLFLTRERTLQRKIKEALLAIQLERQYKKEEILEMYLNQIYFGHGAYGAEQAARAYFGKHVEELTLPECALLAGLPRAPNDYSPRNDPAKAVARRNLVLQKMVSNGFVDSAEMKEAQSAPLNLRETEITNAPYFAAHARKQLEETYGSQAIYRGGLSVYTTLNLRYQTLAQRALEQGLAAAESRIRQTRPDTPASLKLQGALVAVDPRTGAILAMIGGRSFKENEYNRATQAKRQPGSSFKPFIYTAALINGYNPSDLINDSPQQFTGRDGKAWVPSNYDRKFRGMIPLRRSLAFSINNTAVRLLSQVGTWNVISVTKKFGLSGPFRDDLTLGLGTSEVGLLELVSAYTTFANGGVRAAPYSIRLVKDSHGNILEQHRPQLSPVVSPQISYLMLSMLQDVLKYGTGMIIRRLGFSRPAAGKTGSTNDFTDAWFIGFTPSLACGIWIGYDDRRSLGKSMTGGTIAAPIWAEFMTEALENSLVEDFEQPPGLANAVIDPTSGLLATKECQRTVTETFIEGNAPTRQCDKHVVKKTLAEVDLEQLEKMHTPENELQDPGKTRTPDEGDAQETGF